MPQHGSSSMRMREDSEAGVPKEHNIKSPRRGFEKRCGVESGARLYAPWKTQARNVGR